MLRRFCYFQNGIAATMATALADVVGVLAAQGRTQDLARVMRNARNSHFNQYRQKCGILLQSGESVF